MAYFDSPHDWTSASKKYHSDDLPPVMVRVIGLGLGVRVIGVTIGARITTQLGLAWSVSLETDNEYHHAETQHIGTHTHTRLTALFLGLPRWASTRKVKPTWILLKQETVSGSGISWAICKSALRSRQITTPVPHHSSFLQAGCPSCRPTNGVIALKADST